MKAYILINVDLHHIRGVADSLRAIEEITQLDVVTGPYDMIAFLESADINAITTLVTDKIQQIPGISKTLTGFVLPV